MTPRARTHRHTPKSAVSFSLKGSYGTSSHAFLSHTCSFSLTLSNHLMLNSGHIWFNYTTSPLNLLSPSPRSSFLSLSLSLPLEHLNHSDQMCLSILLSLYPPLCFPHALPLLPSPSPSLFSCYCLPHPLSLSLSDLLWECYLYSNNPRRVEQSRTERWGEFDLPKWASPQKHNKTLSLHLCWHHSGSVSSPHHNFQQKYHSLRNTFIITTTTTTTKKAQASSVRSCLSYRSYLLTVKWVTVLRSHKGKCDSEVASVNYWLAGGSPMKNNINAQLTTQGW